MSDDSTRFGGPDEHQAWTARNVPLGIEAVEHVAREESELFRRVLLDSVKVVETETPRAPTVTDEMVIRSANALARDLPGIYQAIKERHGLDKPITPVIRKILEGAFAS